MNHEVAKKFQYEEHGHNISHVDETKSSDVTDLIKETKKFREEQERQGKWTRQGEDDGAEQQKSIAC